MNAILKREHSFLKGFIFVELGAFVGKFFANNQKRKSRHKCGGESLNPTYYIPILVALIILFVLLRNNKMIVAKRIIQKRKSEDKTEMIELAKRFIGKECIIYSFDSNHQFSGTIKEVSDSAILIENGDTLEAINLDFVIRIREYPKKKNGKKKSIVAD